MNLRMLREFTALVSAHCHSVIDAPGSISDSALWNFWDETRKHVGRWSTFLEKSADEVHALSDSLRHQTWQQAEPVLAEIFGLEMLSRVWATVLVASDVRRGTSHAASVAHRTMAGQRHLRHLCLNVMVNWSHENEPRVASVDRFRQRVERWTDVLIGHMAANFAVVDFAFDHKRALEFGHDQLAVSTREPNDQIWKLVHSGMQISFPDASSPRISHPRHLYDFVQAVVCGLPPHLCRPGAPFAPYIADFDPVHAASSLSAGSEMPTLLPPVDSRRSAAAGLGFSDVRSNPA